MQIENRARSGKGKCWFTIIKNKFEFERQELQILKEKNKERRLTFGSREIEESSDSRSSTCEVR